MTALIEGVIGRYVQVPFQGKTYRIYFETAGQGLPLVCLHTAGADSREYRHLLTDDELLERFEVIAFDMPAHGRSLPQDRWWETEYRLTRDFYVGFVAAFCQALDLDRPILMGCSMGGYVMLDIAHEHPERYRGLIAVQPRSYAPAWTALAPMVMAPTVSQHSLTALIHSVCSPGSPEDLARETVWVYATNGPGIMAGDFWYAAEDHDARPFLADLDAKALSLYVIGGDDDPSCLPAHTDELAGQVKGLKVTRIPNCGHFPPSENPVEFRKALVPILDEIAAAPVA